MIIEDLKQLVLSYKKLGLSSTIIEKNIKERLHLLVLEIIYSNEKYRNLVFFGGTCLRICFSSEFQRLSEDLDFIDLARTNADELRDFINTELIKKNLKLDIEIKSKVKEKEFEVSRLHIKFNNLLSVLGLVDNLSSRKMLMIKVEYTFVEKIANLTESERKAFIIPEVIFKDGYSIVLNRLNNSSLMASKMVACKDRKFTIGNTGVNIKGRDYFDFVWYMQKGIYPDSFIFSIYNTTLKEILESIDATVYKIKPSDLKIDIMDLFEDKMFADTFCNNFIDIYKSLRSNYILIDTQSLEMIDVIKTMPKLNDSYQYRYIYKDRNDNKVTFRVSIDGLIFAALESIIDTNINGFVSNKDAFKKLNSITVIPESESEKIILVFIKKYLDEYINGLGKDNLVANSIYEMHTRDSTEIGDLQTIDDAQKMFLNKTLFSMLSPI